MNLVYKQYLLSTDEKTEETSIFNSSGLLMKCKSLKEAKIQCSAKEESSALLFHLKNAVDIIGNNDKVLDTKRCIERIENE